ncbi:MAG: hypothetical protein COA99_07070 [Moraxellaceae bacterium]|nr:MAG: hypothetical protein COA99_07070 [Moraxellaceae bacterium]
MNKYIVSLVFILFSLSCLAGNSAPYIGQENREVKSLSKIEVEGYLAGKGMGIAKAAELNGYPGPRHVLDLSKELNLTEDQIRKSNSLFTTMQSETINLGASLIQKEKELDELFFSGNVDHNKLEISLSQIGKIKSKIRMSHLSAHIEQKKVLTTHQVSLYAHYRGYSGSRSALKNQSHHH